MGKCKPPHAEVSDPLPGATIGALPHLEKCSMQVSELSLDQLDLWAARASGVTTHYNVDGELCYDPGHHLPPRRWAPTRYWSQAGPLIETLHIDLNWDTEGTQEWSASVEPDVLAHGQSPLEAAMRAVVIGHFGIEVE